MIVSLELTTEIGCLLKHGFATKQHSPIMKALLFAADRQERLEKLSIDIKKENTIIIFDRYIHSAIVYRESENIDPEWVSGINKHVPKSDYTFYIDIPVEESIRRKTNAKFNIDYTHEKLKKIRDLYLEYVRKNDLLLVDGFKTEREITETIISKIDFNKGRKINFDEMKIQILSCRDCREEFGFEPNPVVHGKKHSKIMQISQAPSKNVHNTRRPFTDKTGDKLKYKWYQITDEIFYNEDNFYITALAHCYPGKNPSGSGDKPPPQKCAKKWLTKELELVENDIYIIIGSEAAKFLFPKENYNDLIFRNSILNNKTAIVLPHPSPLNRGWFKKHPEFEKQRLPEIKKIIWDVLVIT